MRFKEAVLKIRKELGIDLPLPKWEELQNYELSETKSSIIEEETKINDAYSPLFALATLWRETSEVYFQYQEQILKALNDYIESNKEKGYLNSLRALGDIIKGVRKIFATDENDNPENPPYRVLTFLRGYWYERTIGNLTEVLENYAVLADMFISPFNRPIDFSKEEVRFLKFLAEIDKKWGVRPKVGSLELNPQERLKEIENFEKEKNRKAKKRLR